jgi:hypothetical protein
LVVTVLLARFLVPEEPNGGACRGCLFDRHLRPSPRRQLVYRLRSIAIQRLSLAHEEERRARSEDPVVRFDVIGHRSTQPAQAQRTGSDGLAPPAEHVFESDPIQTLFSSGHAGDDPEVPWSEQTPELLRPYPSERSEFIPLDWFPDGETIVGYLQSKSGVRSGVATYPLSTRGFEEILDFGMSPVWLPDSRRILFQAL